MAAGNTTAGAAANPILTNTDTGNDLPNTTKIILRIFYILGIMGNMYIIIIGQ